MTILPKKKQSKEKPSPLQQQTQDSGNPDKSQEGAAGGHSPTLELEDDLHHYSSPGNYYHRHYSSSGESSPELPVLSKVRYRGASGQTRVKSPSSPTGSPYSGYNSAEEYDGSRNAYFDLEKERVFEEAMKHDRGFVIKKMRQDGACLFRCVADHVYGDQEMHSTVRNHCMDYMLKNAEYFSQFVTEDFEHYINRKRSDRSYGNYLEMQAVAEMYNRCIEVYQYSTEPINTFFGVYKTDNAPIRLSYHGGIHYNSVVDPYEATIGVGLGLAGHKPGVADKNLLARAKKDSERVYLEQTMLEDKLRNSDWESTCEAIEQAVARESYLLWLREQEQKTTDDVGESSRVKIKSAPHLMGIPLPSPIQPLTSSLPITTSSSSSTLVTISSISSNQTWNPSPPTQKPLRARSRSRSSSRSQSPVTMSPQMGRRSPKGSSPARSGRSSPRNSCSTSLRNSPRHSPQTSPLGSPGVKRSNSISRQTSPIFFHQPSPKSVNGSPPGSPLLQRSPPPPSPPPLPPPSPPPHIRNTENQIPHDTNRLLDVTLPSSSLPPPPRYSLDYESGEVLSQLPYEYSSFIDLPPSAFGLLEWEDDHELATVLATSQQEYLDKLKHSSSSRGAESL